jgi:hypothetical protein
MPATTKPKLQTVSLNPKVPAQALAAIVAFVLAKYGIELDAATSGAIATVIGFIAGVVAPPSPTVEVSAGTTYAPPN